MFFKKEEDQILSGNSVYSPTFTLTAETHADFTYPQDGWYWFNTLDDFIAYIANQTPTDSITLRQAKLALLNAGLLTAVNAAIEAEECESCKIEWEYANHVERSSPTVATITSKLGWSEQQMNDLFTAAKLL